MSKNRYLYKIYALLLCVLLCVFLFPVSAFADTTVSVTLPDWIAQFFDTAFEAGGGDTRGGGAGRKVTSSSASDGTPDGFTSSGSAVSPNVTSSGYLVYFLTPVGVMAGSSSSWSDGISTSKVLFSGSSGSSTSFGNFTYTSPFSAVFSLTAPVAGLYFFDSTVSGGTGSYIRDSAWYSFSFQMSSSAALPFYKTLNAGDFSYFFVPPYAVSGGTNSVTVPIKYNLFSVLVYCEPLGDSTTQKYTQYNIPVADSTPYKWNGNIYYDKSTDIYYIYPEDSSGAVSDTPIIYNVTTNQYIVYDVDDETYYYITPTAEDDSSATPTAEPTATPTPTATATPTPTPTATATATATPTPTPTVKPSGGSDDGGDDFTTSPFSGLLDLLGGILSTIISLLWKLIGALLSFILWLLSLLGSLVPWLPSECVVALSAGVVIVLVIRIIKFIL